MKQLTHLLLFLLLPAVLFSQIKITEASDVVNDTTLRLAAFSPDGDGINDVFSFKSIHIQKMKVSIFDKSGNLICESQRLEFEWDGKDGKGKPVPAGIYYFTQTAVGVDGKEYNQKGKINLSR